MDKVIIPPPDIREIIEAACTAIKSQEKNSTTFILSAEKTNSKYSFLNENDPYNPYFTKVLESKQQEHPVVNVPLRGLVVSAEESDRMAESFLHALNYKSMSSYDLNLLKLTALFTSSNDPTFISNLVSKEIYNTQFDFLRAEHSHHEIFNRLVCSFESILFNAGIICNDSFEHILASIKQQAASSFIEPQAGNDFTKSSHAHDWNNFVIGDIVEFNDSPSLSVPLTSDSLSSFSVSERQTVYGMSNKSKHRISLNSLSSMPKVVVCPLCKGHISEKEFDNHFKMESLSSASLSQKRAFQRKFEHLPLEQSTATIKRNISSMLGDYPGSNKKKAV